MARGSKKSYTSKQRRQAHKIEGSAKKQGYSAKRAAQIGYATVNKQDKGGKMPGGGGRGKARTTASGPARQRSLARSISGRKGGRKGGARTVARASSAARRAGASRRSRR